MRRERPIERLLGSVDLTTGAFGLLGLEPGEPAPGAIDRALRARLERLERHPQGSTAEADEVRLTLHVAAAQLRDPEVRRELLRQIGLRRRMGADAGVVSDADAALDELIVQLIVHSGGWNQLARRRVASVLHVYGCDVSRMGDFVVRAMDRIGARRLPVEASRVDVPSGAGESDGGHAEAPRASATTTGMLVVSAALLVSAAVMGWMVLRAGLDEGGRPERRAERSEAPGAEEPGRFAPKAAGPKLGRSLEDGAPAEEPEALFGPDRMIEAILRATRHSRDQPQTALEMFVRALDEVEKKWVDWEWAYIVRANQEMADFVRTVSRQWRDEAGRAVEHLVEGAALLGAGAPVEAARVSEVVWSAGMVNRLVRERTLPDDVIGPALEAHALVFGAGRSPVDQSFLGGAFAAVETLGQRIIPLEGEGERAADVGGAWRAWAGALEALSQEAPEAGEELLLKTIESVLARGGDRSLDSDAQTALTVLLPLVDWSAHGEGREALVRWFGMRGVTTADLANVTAWLAAHRESEEGLGDVTSRFVLSANADRATRSDVRDLYAQAWGLSVRPREMRLEGRWLQEVRSALAGSAGAERLAESLEWTARLAALNAVSARRWAGDSEGATEALEDLAGMVYDARDRAEKAGRVRIDPALLTGPGPGADGEWAARIKSTRRDSEEKLRLLRRLKERAAGLGPADADVLVELAYFGAPSEVRDAAQQIVVSRADDPAIVNALLEMVAGAPRTPGVAEMLESVTRRTLPEARDPGFRRPAREALVQRLLEMLSAQEIALVDALHAVIAEQYEQRVASLTGRVIDAGPGGMGPPGMGEAPDAAEQATALWGAWRDEAGRGVGAEWTFSQLNRLTRRREARDQLAEGPIQRFAGEQASIAELMALVVGSEYASQEARVRGILDDMAAERRNAESVFGQALAAERAMLRLWIVRFGELEEEPS